MLKLIPLFQPEGAVPGEPLTHIVLDPRAVALVEPEIRRVAWIPEPGKVTVEAIRTAVVRLLSGDAVEVLDPNRMVAQQVKEGQEDD